jgi:hypothetical protein
MPAPAIERKKETMRRLPAHLLLISALGNSPALAQAAESAFSLTITAPRDTVKSGGDLRLDISLKNISDRDQSVAYTSPEVTFDIRAFDFAGKPVGKTPSHRAVRGDDGSWNWSGSAIISTFKPGKEVHQEVSLQKLFDLDRPGKYTVEVRFLDVLGNKAIVKSNTITVTVTP